MQRMPVQALLSHLLPGIAMPAAAQQGPSSLTSQGAAAASKMCGSWARPAHAAGDSASARSTTSMQLHACLAAVLTCRLTGRLLCDPVIAADGYTYEREAFEAWLAAGHRHSPVTSCPLGVVGVRPNRAVRELLAPGESGLL